MIGTLLILSGMMLMIWPLRPVPDMHGQAEAGILLQEAFAGAAAQPVPRDMRRLIRSIDSEPRRVARRV